MNAISTMIDGKSKANLKVIREKLPTKGQIIFRRYMEAADQLKAATLPGLKLIFTRKGKLKFFEGVKLISKRNKIHYYSTILDNDSQVVFLPCSREYREYKVEEIIQKYKS